MKGLLKSGKKFRVTRPVVFLPGLTDEFVLEHTKSLRMHDFNGPEMEQVKNMLFYKGSISCFCKLNKKCFILSANDLPVISVFIKNQSKSRHVKSVEFKIKYQVEAIGWNWMGYELANKKIVRVPLIQTETMVDIRPGDETGIHYPLQIADEFLPTLPPSFSSKSISVKYFIDAIIHIPGATDKMLYSLPVQFLIPEGNQFNKKKEIQKKDTIDNQTPTEITIT